ncbi:hypothetical protein Pint_26868 [Pistacia integerrima]|uniref:Uncharacterized protein n=1 Tax=Pistacia integerrima TaxID=434235 RepID=A0ACC0YVC0_9ROSI|nr:hypothetical protein Pint_26868 [Pistacia integerrima]
MIEVGAVGDLRPQFLYLLELGMDLEFVFVFLKLKMKALCAIQSSELSSIFRGTFSITRSRPTFPEKLFFCRAKFAESGVDGSFSLSVVSPALLAAEKEEAKGVLTLFLKKQGLSKAFAARTINTSDLFIDHLVSRLHSVHKSRYLVGRELTTLEIRDALMSYLETLHEEYGKILVELVENFPNAPVKEKPVAQVSPSHPTVDSKKLKAVSRVSEAGPEGDLSPQVLYLIELGMDLEQIKSSTHRFPGFAKYSLEGKIKPLVEFLLDLGVLKSDIPVILTKRPQLFGFSLSENLIPTKIFLEDLGVDKKKWAKVIYRSPALLTHSRQKLKSYVDFFYEMGLSTESVGKILTKRPQLFGFSLSKNLMPTMKFLEELGVDKKQWAKVIYRCPTVLCYSWQRLKSTVDFLYEMGLSAKSIGKILTQCPNIISYSVENKLRPTAEYFRSLGVDIPVLLQRCPQILGLSIEANLKPVTEFFIERGFRMEEIGIMISRYGILYTLSLKENLIPKWEFFLTMDYDKSELVKFPQYFGYSLEERIKPRYARVKECGVTVLLSQMLSLSSHDFDKTLNKKMKKMLSEEGSTDSNGRG